MNHSQKKVAIGVLASWVVSSLYLYLGYQHWPIPIPSLAAAPDRLVFVIKMETFSAMVIFFAIATVGNQRFFSSAIDGRTNLSGSIDINRRFLQNTLEQWVLAFIAHLSLSTFLEPNQMTIIPALISWWIFARLLFWYGYHRFSAARALGFASTFFPTLGVLLYDLGQLIFN